MVRGSEAASRVGEPVYHVGQGQDERARPPAPSLLRGLDSAWGVVSNPHRHRGNAVSGRGRRWSGSGRGLPSAERPRREPVGRLRWSRDVRDFQGTWQRCTCSTGQEGHEWPGLRPRGDGAHGPVWPLQRSQFDTAPSSSRRRREYAPRHWPAHGPRRYGSCPQPVCVGNTPWPTLPDGYCARQIGARHCARA